MRTKRIVAAFGAAVGGALLALMPVSHAQTLKPLRAEWRDLETWGRYLEASRETEVGVGLQVAGPQGTMLVGFTGRLDIRNATAPPSEVTIQIGTAHSSNPNVVRRPTAVLRLDEKIADRKLVLDLTPRLIVDNPSPGGPGAIVENGVATIRAADFVRLCSAETLTGEAFGFELVFRPDHVAAIHDLGVRLNLVKPR
jgi:hypothetical protein